jgi:cobalt transporter subunit CbtB
MMSKANTKYVNFFGYQLKLRSVTMVVVIFALVLGLISWLLLSPWGTVHDPTHWIRHSLGFVPCH